MSYARARLWIGISGVGLIVVACVTGISLQLPQLFLPTSESGVIADLGWLAAAVALFAAIMAPLDFWGGYLAPARFNHQPISLARFLKQWSRGVIVQSLLFVASSIIILTVGRSTGLFGAAISIVVMSILYVAWQSRLIAAMTDGTTLNDDDKVDRSLDRAERWGLKRLPVTVIQNTDPGFTGGVLGMPRFESLTLWTFLGLLTLPTVSRQSTYAIDSELLRRGADMKTFTETISALDSVQDDEPSRAALVETIFHPVPSVDNRQRSEQSGSPLAWHAARMTLFLSWSCMGLLSRAVHCNVGRPELWAMLPTD